MIYDSLRLDLPFAHAIHDHHRRFSPTADEMLANFQAKWGFSW